MTWFHWSKRFVFALVIAGTLLFAVQRLKGHAAINAVVFAALWSTVSAGIFTGVGYARYRRDPACMLPRSRRG